MKLIGDIREAWLLDEEPKRQLLAIEKITLAYLMLTTILVFLYWGGMMNPGRLLAERFAIVAVMGCLYLIHRRFPSEGTRFLRNLFPLLLLSYWYPDTYEFCQMIDNLDYLFADADKALFGCQPALEFSKALNGKVWSELFYMGYFSYFPMIVCGLVLPLFRSRRLFEKTAFIVMASFFLYYVIYLFLPVAGPQFYFPAAGISNILHGHYPMLEDYFRTHAELGPTVGADGLFKSLVEIAHNSGERPIAAFPSSHVGVSTILMVLFWRHFRRVFYVFAPFFVLLCASTVYIQAHYLVDVFGGFATAALFYPFAHWLYGELHVKDRHRRSRSNSRGHRHRKETR